MIRRPPRSTRTDTLFPYTTLFRSISPARHRAFSTPMEMMHFIAQLRTLSGGKPVGFKLCIGQPWEFMGMVKAMREPSICPDFIVIDGAEGGTGASPLEFSRSEERRVGKECVRTCRSRG